MARIERTKELTVRLTEEDWQLLDAQAAVCGETVTDYASNQLHNALLVTEKWGWAKLNRILQTLVKWKADERRHHEWDRLALNDEDG